MTSNRLRTLPSIDKLINTPGAADLIARYGRTAAVEALRMELDTTRARLRSGQQADTTSDALLTAADEHLRRQFQPTLRPVINATGVILHTNLGRAPLSESARQAMLDVAAGYSTLEYDLDSGGRGSRLLHAGALLAQLTGAEDALVVNNNAAATVLLLAELAQGKQVIVSRGQLVEIGGGFRVPDIMQQSGARLIEVGTTNRTRAADYERAITPETALLMRVHSSNFKQIGFVEETPLADLTALARRHNLAVVDDLGSGALLDTAQVGLSREPMPQESIAAGVDVICFSGDKLLGGPQAGILVGRRDLIGRLKKHPLARAIRADKLCLAALTATLDHYRRGEALEKIPVLWMLNRTAASLRTLAEQWAGQINQAVGKDVACVIEGQSTVGGGSLPGEMLPTALVALSVPQVDDFAAKLRQAQTPVIARIQDGRLMLDPRTVLAGQETALLNSLVQAMQGLRL